jgi:hypothetical protein
LPAPPTTLVVDVVLGGVVVVLLFVELEVDVVVVVVVEVLLGSVVFGGVTFGGVRTVADVVLVSVSGTKLDVLGGVVTDEVWLLFTFDEGDRGGSPPRAAIR